jgi:hypothetical protein
MRAGGADDAADTGHEGEGEDGASSGGDGAGAVQTDTPVIQDPGVSRKCKDDLNTIVQPKKSAGYRVMSSSLYVLVDKSIQHCIEFYGSLPRAGFTASNLIQSSLKPLSI